MQYQLIYADPPWDYDNKNCQGTTLNHYPSMKAKDIYALPVNEISDNDAILFLWVTFPKLIEGLKTMDAWGFKYKTLGMSWVKLNPKALTPFYGIGYYFKSNIEVCLLGLKGKPQRPAVNTISSLIMAPRGRHSQKPIEAYEKIEKGYPHLRKVELFARQKREGWDSWGNEIESDLSLEVV